MAEKPSAMLRFHEAANIFPMDDEHLDELAKDIKAQGQQIPIELMGGTILDGRRRYMACRIAGVEPKFRDVHPEDPVAYVLSLNLHRRHLTTSQAAMCAARAIEVYKAAAKERQKTSTGGPNPQLCAEMHKAEKGRASVKAGEAFGVSGRTVDYATRVVRKGVPEVVKAVDEGRITVNKAAEIVKAPPEKQAEELNKPRPERAKAREEQPRPRAPRHPGEHTQSEVFAQNKARVAITQLEGIPEDNPHRDAALEIVVKWINKQRKNV